MLSVVFGTCVNGPCTLPEEISSGFSAEVSMGSWLNDLSEGLLSMNEGASNDMVLNFSFDIRRKHVLRLSYGYQIGTAADCAPNDPVTVTRGNSQPMLLLQPA